MVVHGGETAIPRSRLAAPLRWLTDEGLLHGKLLDFGCGRGDDLRRLKRRKSVQAFGWDPYWRPRPDPEANAPYDVVYLGYVLNVIPERDEAEVREHARGLCKVDGMVYYAVRRDLDTRGHQGRGTRQRYVRLSWADLIFEDGNFAIYAE